MTDMYILSACIGLVGCDFWLSEQSSQHDYFALVVKHNKI